MRKNGVYSVIKGSETTGQSPGRKYCGGVPGVMTAKALDSRNDRVTQVSERRCVVLR